MRKIEKHLVNFEISESLSELKSDYEKIKKQMRKRSEVLNKIDKELRDYNFKLSGYTPKSIPGGADFTLQQTKLVDKNEVTSKEEAQTTAINTKLLNESIDDAKSLFGDPNFAPIVGAKDSDWSEKANQVKHFGLFGNSEFTIIRESLGLYRIKSQTFDPSHFVNIMPDMATLALKVAAASYGVPINPITGDVTSSNENTSRVQLKVSVNNLKTKILKSNLAKMNLIEDLIILYGDSGALPNMKIKIKDTVNNNLMGIRAGLAAVE